MLKQVSQMNTVSRRKSIAEPDIIHTSLNRARAHDAMLLAFGFGRGLHRWLVPLDSAADTGERFLFDYLKLCRPGSSSSTEAPAGIAASSSESTATSSIPRGADLGGTEMLRDRATLVVTFTRPTLPSLEMKKASTAEERRTVANERSSQPQDVFTRLCKAADVPCSETPYPSCKKTLRQIFNLGVPASRLKPDRGITLCPETGDCFLEHWNGSYNADGTKRQPRLHKLNCAYNHLQKLHDYMKAHPRFQ